MKTTHAFVMWRQQGSGVDEKHLKLFLGFSNKSQNDLLSLNLMLIPGSSQRL